MHNKFVKAVRAILGLDTPVIAGRYVGRARTMDVAFLYRMGAGFMGDVNRTHPASIEPTITADDSVYFGGVVVVEDNFIRLIETGDTLPDVWGVAVRPYPFQQQSGGMAASFSTGPASALGPGANKTCDVIRQGYIMGYVNGTPNKGDPVFVWISADAGDNYQGSFVATLTADSIALTGWRFNGPPDANGIVEVEVNMP